VASAKSAQNKAAAAAASTSSIATPGRLLDLIGPAARRALGHLEVLVLDEADRMLDMGFIHDMKKHRRRCVPEEAPDAALLGDDARTRSAALAATQFLSDGPGARRRHAAVDHRRENRDAVRLSSSSKANDKREAARRADPLTSPTTSKQVLVFTRTKHGANRLSEQLLEGSGIVAAAIHGNKSQGARERALSSFKRGHDPRARRDRSRGARHRRRRRLRTSFNYELPNVPESYVHRIGRTAAPARAGIACGLLCRRRARALERHRAHHPHADPRRHRASVRVERRARTRHERPTRARRWSSTRQRRARRPIARRRWRRRRWSRRPQRRRRWWRWSSTKRWWRRRTQRWRRWSFEHRFVVVVGWSRGRWRRWRHKQHATAGRAWARAIVWPRPTLIDRGAIERGAKGTRLAQELTRESLQSPRKERSESLHDVFLSCCN
jgi:superfamily II DNA/RNA helicase